MVAAGAGIAEERHLAHRFAELAFTESVREVQEALGSRASYTSMEGGEDYNHVPRRARGRFHQGTRQLLHGEREDEAGPTSSTAAVRPGLFAFSIERTIGFADFRGNRST